MTDENDNASGTDDGAAGQSDEPTIEQLRAKVTTLEQDKARLSEQLDAITPLVNLDGEAGESGEGEPAPDKELQRTVEGLKHALNDVNAKLFLAENPDLKGMEDLIYVKYQQTDPRLKPDERLAKAAEATRSFVKDMRETAVKENAEVTEKKKKATAATAGVLEGESKPPETPEEDEGWTSDTDYAGDRQNVTHYGGFTQ